MNVECRLCSYTERMVEVHLGSLRLLFHKRFLAALPEQGSAARDALVQMDVFPPACTVTSAALLSRSWRCSGCQPRGLAFARDWQRLFQAALLGERHCEQSCR